VGPPVHLLSRRPRQRRRRCGCRPRRERRQQRASWHRGRQSLVSGAKGCWRACAITTRRGCVAAMCWAPSVAFALSGTGTAWPSRRAIRLVPVTAVHASKALAPSNTAALRLRLWLPACREELPRILCLSAHRLIWRAPPSCRHVIITLAHSAPVARTHIARVLPQAASAGGREARRRRRVGPARRRGRAQHAGTVQAERWAPRTGGDWRVANLSTPTWQLCRGAVLLRRAQLSSLAAVVTHVTRPRPAAVAAPR
jgi:hypothetical protein